MKTCVLFSGGYDCIAAVSRLDSTIGVDLIFFNYNQRYLDQELEVVEKFADEKGMRLIVIRPESMYHDMPRRNFHFISMVHELGYQKIITGNRNILPIFDKYKDSNWFSIKLFSWLMGVKVVMPVLLWPKFFIMAKCMDYFKTGEPYNCYHAEPDYRFCDCPNCEEKKRLIPFLNRI